MLYSSWNIWKLKNLLSCKQIGRIMTDSDLVIMCLLSSYSNQSGNVCRVDLLLCLLAAIDKHHWKSKDFYPYVNCGIRDSKIVCWRANWNRQVHNTCVETILCFSLASIVVPVKRSIFASQLTILYEKHIFLTSRNFQVWFTILIYCIKQMYFSTKKIAAWFSWLVAFS